MVAALGQRWRATWRTVGVLLIAAGAACGDAKPSAGASSQATVDVGAPDIAALETSRALDSAAVPDATSPDAPGPADLDPADVDTAELPASRPPDAVPDAPTPDAPQVDAAPSLCAVDGAPCNDGDPCTVESFCAGGTCVASPANWCQCQADADCASAEDGDACNGTLYCQKTVFPYTCKLNPKSIVTCPASPNACQTALCLPATGACTTVPVADAKPCDDGEPCTTGDVCKGGACKPGTDFCSCVDDASCAAQEDGNPCNGTLYCDKGAKPALCKVNPATVIPCPTVGDTACLKNTCNPATAVCAPKAVTAATACDDSNSCTTGDACLGGACVAGKDTCVCNSDADCKAEDDGNLCNGTLFCNQVNKKCQLNPASIVTCPSVGDTACHKNKCQPKTGQCQDVDEPDGAACSDGSDCTNGDACAAGQCVAGTYVCACKSNAECAKSHDGDFCAGTMYCNKAKTPAVCELNPATKVTCPTASDTTCQKTLCVPATGQCETKNVNEFQPCDADGLVCTLYDVCVAGKCKAGASICECLQDADCKDDGDLCNGVAYCDKGKPLFTCLQKPGSAVVCKGTGQEPCSVAQCQPKLGTCTTAVGLDGLECSDGTACTSGDVCKGGACVAGAALPCDDGQACTADTCHPQKGCVHAALLGPCSDGDACTGNDTCKGGACQAGPAVVCADNNGCTDDGCDKQKGCVYAPNAATCTDGDACTLGDGCKGGVCATSGVNPCSDAEPCTGDACDAQTGLCSHKATTACERAACLQSSDCAQGLRCDATVNSCVACTHSSHCGPNQACQGGLCVAGTACESFVPCKPKGMVCSAATGSCVECLQNGDCGTGKVCQGQRCAAAVPCQTDQDCPAVCNLTLKVCADCNADGDCPGGACGADHMCRPGHATVAQCSGDNLFAPLAGKQAYQPTICTDSNLCTDGGCALPAGCTQTFNSAPCDDGAVCTTGDACKGGACAAGKGNKCDDGKPCSLDVCEADTGTCSHEPYEGPCSDGNACTVGEVCAGGSCKGGKVVVCDDGNACSDDSCAPKSGCGFVANQAACDSGSCTTGDACKDGVCVSSKQKVVWESVVAGSKPAIVRGIAALGTGFYAVVSYGTASQADGGTLLRVDGQGKVVWQAEPALGPGGAIYGVATVGGSAVVCGTACTGGQCFFWTGKYGADGAKLDNTKSGVGAWHAVAAAPGGDLVFAGRHGATAYIERHGGQVSPQTLWFAYPNLAVKSSLHAVAVIGSEVVVAGWTESAANGSEGLVARFNGAGKAQWIRSFGGSGKDEFAAVAAMGNGDIALAGSTGSKGEGGRDGWFVRLVGMGERADDRTFGTAGDDEFLAIADTGGRLALAGRTQGKGTATHGWLLALDGWGNTDWQRKWAGDHGADAFFAVTPHGSGLLVGGGKHDFTGQPNAGLLRTDTWGHATCATATGCIDKSAVDCDDGKPCTLDGCEQGSCQSKPSVYTLPCDKGAGFCAGEVCKPAPVSCLALRDAVPDSASGVFKVDPDGPNGTLAPFATWCDQTHDGGGWTLLLKADPTTQSFIYDSPLWLSPSPFNPDKPGFDTTEAKLAGYTSLPLKELRVGLRSGGIVRSLYFDADGPSLLGLMGTKVASKLGVASWANLTPPPYGTGPVFNFLEGVNPPEHVDAKVRIGGRYHGTGSGVSPGGAIGLGCFVVCGKDVVPVGAIRCSVAAVPAFGYVFVR